MLQESGNFSFFHFCFNQFILYILLELKKKRCNFLSSMTTAWMRYFYVTIQKFIF